MGSRSHCTEMFLPHTREEDTELSEEEQEFAEEVSKDGAEERDEETERDAASLWEETESGSGSGRSSRTDPEAGEGTIEESETGRDTWETQRHAWRQTECSGDGGCEESCGESDGTLTLRGGERERGRDSYTCDIYCTST